MFDLSKLMRSIYENCCDMAEEYLTVEEYNKTKSNLRKIDEEKLDFTSDQQKIFDTANAKELKGIITNFSGFFGVGKLDFSKKRHLEVVKGDLLGEYEDLKMHLLVFINVQFDLLKDHLTKNDRFQLKGEVQKTMDPLPLTNIDAERNDLAKNQSPQSSNIDGEQLMKENEHLKEKIKILDDENKLLKKHLNLMKDKAMELNRFYQGITS